MEAVGSRKWPNAPYKRLKLVRNSPPALSDFSDFPPRVVIQTQVGDADTTQNESGGSRRKLTEAEK